MPAITAFCNNSKLARPLSNRIDVVGGKVAGQEARADQLVERIVTADVFAQAEQFARAA